MLRGTRPPLQSSSLTFSCVLLFKTITHALRTGAPQRRRCSDEGHGTQDGTAIAAPRLFLGRTEGCLSATVQAAAVRAQFCAPAGTRVLVQLPYGRGERDDELTTSV